MADVIRQVQDLPAEDLETLLGCGVPSVVAGVRAAFVAWLSRRDGLLATVRYEHWSEAWGLFVHMAKVADMLPPGHSRDRLVFPGYEAQMLTLYGAKADAVRELISRAAEAQDRLVIDLDLDRA